MLWDPKKRRHRHQRTVQLGRAQSDQQQCPFRCLGCYWTTAIICENIAHNHNRPKFTMGTLGYFSNSPGLVNRWWMVLVRRSGQGFLFKYPTPLPSEFWYHLVIQCLYIFVFIRNGLLFTLMVHVSQCVTRRRLVGGPIRHDAAWCGRYQATYSGQRNQLTWVKLGMKWNPNQLTLLNDHMTTKTMISRVNREIMGLRLSGWSELSISRFRLLSRKVGRSSDSNSMLGTTLIF